MNSTKILVCLYSDANFLSVGILENILFKNCYVLIITKDIEKWKSLTEHLGNKSRFSFIKPGELNKPFYFNYSFFCGGFINKEDAYKEYSDFSKNDNILATKTLAVFPFESYSAKNDSTINVNGNTGIIYLGDLFGPRIDLMSDLTAPQLINRILHKKEIRLPIGEVVYPVFVADAAKTISKWLFSFGPYGKEIFLLGEQVSSSGFWIANKKFIPDLSLIQEKTEKGGIYLKTMK